jgi:hypothetical protein
MHSGQVQVVRARAAGRGKGNGDVPSTLLGSDLFALSLGLDMLDVGGFVTAAIVGG